MDISTPYKRGLAHALIFVRQDYADMLLADEKGGLVDAIFDEMLQEDYRWLAANTDVPIGSAKEQLLSRAAWLEVYTMQRDGWHRDYSSNPDAPLMDTAALDGLLRRRVQGAKHIIAQRDGFEVAL